MDTRAPAPTTASALACVLVHVGKPLADTGLSDLHGYLATRSGWAPPTRTLATATTKILFSLPQEPSCAWFNIGAAMELPAVKDALAERS